MKNEISLDEMRVQLGQSTLPITVWLTQEIERWLFTRDNVEVKAQIVMDDVNESFE